MSDESKTIEDAIEENAAGPRKASNDSISVEQHPLKDQIEADKYLQSKKAAVGKGLGVKFSKLSPDGTT